jgi:hypothetical protein
MMKSICTFCGHANRAEAAHCACCGGSLADARRERFKLPLASWIPAIPVAALLSFQYMASERALSQIRSTTSGNAQRIAAEHQAALRKLQAEHDDRETALENTHRAQLADARLISGVNAAARHADEWRRRQAHDPAFANSLIEKTLLEVERLGKDPALSAEAALRKVAELVTPPGSRIEVTQGDRGFIVRVAFRLSAVDPNEAGGGTRHTSSADVRKQIEEVTAHVIKDLFDSTGARGIQRLSVSCNRALVTGKDDNEHLAMRSLYRAVVEADQASQIANWRSLSTRQIAALMKVEHDVLATVVISKGGKPGLTLDPNEPLEF